MTVDEMHIAVFTELMKVGAFVHDNYLSEEVDQFLNKAQNRFIKQRLSRLSNVKRLGFEESTKRLEDLRELVVDDYFDEAEVQQGDTHNDFDLPSDMLFLIPGTVRADVDVCGKSRLVPVRIVETDWIYKMTANPFARSLPHSPLGKVYDDQVKILFNNEFTVQKIYLDYIKKPRAIDIFTHTNCELSESVHQEIVDLTVNIMLEAGEQPRVQTHTQQLLMNE